MRARWRIGAGVALALGLLAGAAGTAYAEPRATKHVAAVTSPASPEARPSPRRRVERVIDGDTFVLTGGETVRLIGVDTPESVHPRKPVQRHAKQAAAFTRRLILGAAVRLTHDRERTDRYGRTLAYVELPDGRVLNEVLLETGHARAYTAFPFAHRQRYRALERQARTASAGLWGPGEAEARPSEQGPATTLAVAVVTPCGSCYHRPSCARVRAHTTLAVAEVGDRRPCHTCKPASR